MTVPNDIFFYLLGKTIDIERQSIILKCWEKSIDLDRFNRPNADWIELTSLSGVIRRTGQTRTFAEMLCDVSKEINKLLTEIDQIVTTKLSLNTLDAEYLFGQGGESWRWCMMLKGFCVLIASGIDIESLPTDGPEWFRAHCCSGGWRYECVIETGRVGKKAEPPNNSMNWGRTLY